MERKYISVLTLNQYIKAKFHEDGSLQNILIKGEISNYRPHPSGHIYFTLKDEKSRIQAVMFQSSAKNLDFEIENGKEVLIEGSVAVYEVTGQYQLYIKKMQPDGIGQLYLQYEKLKKKLESEGLFEQKYKKDIPLFPRNIAVLSAKQGAAVQDVVRTLKLRFPFTRVIIFPIPVQGKNAYLDIIETLTQVDKIGFDTIILARGGGSIEDLWNFNEEALARCIFSLKTPMISGIGHETDFTICDFVSDYRAATPTAAAIKASPDQYELRKYLRTLHQQLEYKMKSYLKYQNQNLYRLKNSYILSNPEHLYINEVMRLNQLKQQLSHHFQVFDMTVYQQILQYQKQMKQLMDLKFMNQEKKMEVLISRLDALSPLKVMQRGYTLIKKDDLLIKEAKQLKKGDIIDITFYDSNKKAEIK